MIQGAQPPRPVPKVEPAFRLDETERNSVLWQRLSQYMAERLERVRLQNDTPQPEAKTAELRGEISCLKSLIRLGSERPAQGGQ